MKQSKARDELVALMSTPFGMVPEIYTPFMRGEPDFTDVGVTVFGQDFGCRLLANAEAVRLLTAEAVDRGSDDPARVLRRSVLRVLNYLTGEPANCMVVVREARAWFGRPVLIHQHLDGKEPFIAIAA
jgi:hypothetical protein